MGWLGSSVPARISVDERVPVMKTRVFLGSTFEDLREHRSKCIEILDRKGFDWVGMERQDAVSLPPLEFCLQQVASCHIYLGIFGFRYGHVDAASGRSIMELEYREAKRLGLPCLIYLIESHALVPGDYVETGDNALKLHDLKRDVADSTKGHVVGRFSTPADLATNLAIDIDNARNILEKTHGMSSLRTEIDHGITRGVRFILDMEIKPAGGWNYHTLGVGNCWDTAYSMLALVASGEESVAAQLLRGQRWLLSTRNQYGGWGSAYSQASTTIDTALALIALCESGYEERPQEIELTAEYLRNAQHPWGGWPDTIGTGWPTTGATGWAISALHSPGLTPNREFGAKALEWLLNNQRDDGGWAVDRGHLLSTIGKTCDALMGLSRFRTADTEGATCRAGAWLLKARGEKAANEFGSNISIEPQGVNPVVENVSLFLEAAFYAGIPAGNPMVRSDLEWLAGRRLWSNTPRALWCLSQYRKWIT